MRIRERAAHKPVWRAAHSAQPPLQPCAVVNRGRPLLSVQRLPRITGVTDGQPTADGAAVPRPATVIWATGYRPGLDWIAGLPLDEQGLPVTRRGAVESMPGLFFVGMPFQYALTSALLGGVGRDAGLVVDSAVEA